MHPARTPIVTVLLSASLSLAGCTGPGTSTATDPTAGTQAPPPANTGTVAPDSTLGEAPPQLRVQISEDERNELLGQTMDDLDTARATAAQQPDPTALSPEQRQRWETLDHYIELTESFLGEDDLRAAADVALKARLLAAELHRD